VFVDGPYASGAAAAAAAQTLEGIETASSGGRYEVTAALTKHLGPIVNAVVGCLNS
jgi:hypothetical protein